MELLPHQQPYFETLLGVPDCIDGTRRGATRAWIDMPIGYGKTHTVCAAIKSMHVEHRGVLTVLYVTQRPVFGHIADLMGDVPCRQINPEADILVGVELCSQRMLCKYHDTAIQYGNYDLAVLDLMFDPFSGRGGKSLNAAVRTLLRTSRRLWIVGARA